MLNMEMLELAIRHTVGELVINDVNVGLEKMLVLILALRCCSCMWLSSIGVNIPRYGIWNSIWCISAT